MKIGVYSLIGDYSRVYGNLRIKGRNQQYLAANKDSPGDDLELEDSS